MLVLSAVAAWSGSAQAGQMLPGSSGGHTYQQLGSVSDPATPPTFSCQLPTASVRCYGPAQIQNAYDISPLYARGITGAGRTIVIVDAFQSPTIAHDLALFDQVFELPDPTLNIIAPDGLTPFDQGDPNMVGWAGEISLDVEWAHAIAPAATIDLVLAKSNNDADILSATRYAVDNNLGDVISQSFGEAEQCMDPALLDAQHALFDQASSQKISLFASSGDQGAALPTCDNSGFFKAASTPATDPGVTAVGGTQFVADGLTGAYQSETTWNEFNTFGAAGGGGFSVLYKRPGYQNQAVAGHKRGIPDISYNAAIDGGVLTVWSSSGEGSDLVFLFGGTSAGSPQWAGLTALADQLKGKRVGKVNKSLYKLAKTAPATYFHDITTGDNSFGSITGFAAVAGWDAATGLGTPRANNLVVALANRHAP